ncbi:MAG: STAS domain-containing protein [Phycisphaerales bacterium]|nr:STAS domain-containing protein [Phycisphaerales bacterium]
MSTEASRIRVTDLQGVMRVEFVDRDILDEAAIRQISSELVRRVDAAASPLMLISFRGVEHLSSAALGALITVNSLAKKRGGQLRLSDIKPSILEVFVITKLNKLFHISDTAERALEGFGRK